MYHLHFRGAHYEIGLRFGQSLAKNGQSLLSNLPFPITEERKAFARACVPVYQRFFPEILEEIQGLAEGQHCAPELLQAVLFSMYAIPPACGCSCFAVSEQNHILLGRNSDFSPELEKLNTNVIYKFANGAYSFTGNTTAFIEMEDGVNQHGLAAGLTFVPPTAKKPGLNAGMLVRFFLEKCRSTQEVLRCIRQLPIGSAQTITVADAAGDIAIIECCPEQAAVIRPTEQQPFVCGVNVFHAETMLPLQMLQGGNWRSEERYATLTQTLKAQSGKMDADAAKSLLSGKTGFLCQYDRSCGTDTVWSVIYDLTAKSIYRAEGNPGRKRFIKDERFPMG